MNLLATIELPEYSEQLVHLYYVSRGKDHATTRHVVPPTRYEALWITETRGVAKMGDALPPSHRPRNALAGIKRYGMDYIKTWDLTRRKGQAVMDLRRFEPNNIAHLLLEIIPLWLLACSVEKQPPIVLVRNIRPDYLEVLQHFGIEVIVTAGDVIARQISVMASRGLAAYDFPLPDVPAQCLAPIGEIYRSRYLPGNQAAGAGPRIVIGRRGARRITNEDEVRALTDRYGYRWVYMEDHSVAEKLAIGAAAQHVVTVHGAGMSPLAVASPLASIVELLPSNAYSEYFPVCLNVQRGSYYQLMPEFDPAIVARGWSAVVKAKSEDQTVNVRHLETVLDNVHHAEAACTGQAAVELPAQGS